MGIHETHIQRQIEALESKRLPDKPSALIRVALDDLETIEADSRYRVKMTIWHEPSLNDNLCAVCLAGAVIARRLVEAPNNELHPDNFPEEDKLVALDKFRSGAIPSGMAWMGYENKSERVSTIGDWLITPYESNAGLFKADLHALADYLEQHGF